MPDLGMLSPYIEHTKKYKSIGKLERNLPIIAP